MTKQNLGIMKTIIELLEVSSKRFANNPYLFEKKGDRYKSITYKETREEAYKVAAGLLSLGILKGERVALISESRTDWVTSELGILHARAVSVPLSIMLKKGNDLKFRLGTSGVVVRNLDLKICDEKGKVMPDGEKGEIVIRGENVMAGYYKNEKAT
jgi:long-subunit acyl-CoA synthetase (AMP-forming)